MKLSVKEMCIIGLFAALIAVGAQIVIPLPGGVPMTLQVWAILLASLVLGAKLGFMATLVYVLLGAAGVPVFAQFTGGIGIVLGATGGFILSFPLMAIIVSIFAKKQGRVFLTIGLVTALFVNFAVGMLYFAMVTQNSLQAAFLMAVAPFLPVAGLQIIVFAVWGPNLKILMAQAVRQG